MLQVEVNHQLNNFTEQGESELIVEDSQPSWRLVLFDSQSFKFTDCETVRPPVSFIIATVEPFLDSSRELGFAADVGNAGEERVVHDQQFLLFGVDHVKFDEIGALVEGSREGLEGVFGQDGAKSPVGNIQGPACLVDVRS